MDPNERIVVGGEIASTFARLKVAVVQKKQLQGQAGTEYKQPRQKKKTEEMRERPNNGRTKAVQKRREAEGGGELK